VDWARARRLKVFVGEVGLAAESVRGPEAWRRLMAYAEENRDVVLGFAWWAVGDPRFWGEYKFTLLDRAGQDTEQMRMIEGNLH
jgi:hypothetical protein